LEIILIIILIFASRDSTTAEESVDYIVTGAVDDLVKVWIFKNDRLELKHKLEGHSLGVVSVAINSDSTSE
jgi:WD domain, G-beta repeat.